MTVFSQKKQAYPSAAVKRNNNYCNGNLHNYGVRAAKCYETNSLLGLFRYPVELLCLFDKTLNMIPSKFSFQTLLPSTVGGNLTKFRVTVAFAATRVKNAQLMW